MLDEPAGVVRPQLAVADATAIRASSHRGGLATAAAVLEAPVNGTGKKR